MRILICDYANVMEKDYTLTINAMKEILPDAEIIIQSYQNKENLYEVLGNVDGMITAFLPLDSEFFGHVRKLKCISVNATGYGNIDLEAAKRSKVGICHIEEYCTEEVAEHTMALICALNRNLKYYTRKVEQDHQWKYHSINGGRPLSCQKLVIFGLGKIGKRVAKIAQGFGMEVLAVDPYLKMEDAQFLNVRLVTAEEAFREADIISNHMNLTPDNYHFFDIKSFEKMKKNPLFINVGRGSCVDEKALAIALDNGAIRGAGLDVLEAEEPILDSNPLLGRDNVVITPHSAFYSEESMDKLQIISGENLAYYLSGNLENIHKIVGA